MSSRLCTSCNVPFTGPRLLKQEQPHHSTGESAVAAADQGCYICSTITKSDGWKGFDGDAELETFWYLEPLLGNLSGWFNLTINAVVRDTDSSDSSEEDEIDEENLTTADVDQDAEPGDQTVDEEMENKLVPPTVWTFAIQPATEFEEYTMRYTPPQDSSHPSILDLGYQWHLKCRADHATCNNQIPTFQPTRLLELVSKDRGRVILTKNEISTHPYATFSHCWGKAKTLRLMTSNIDQLQSGIDLHDLPTSYREAILVCHRFGFRYIWVDSLCIIQDSTDDWHREAMAMKDVYRNTGLNIAAAAAAENTESSFAARDASTISPLPIETRWESHGPGKFYLTNVNAYRDEVSSSPLRRRAWVVQEVWLAARNLYLTKNQLWWKCCELEASETYPEGLPEAWSSQGSLTGYGKQRYDPAGLHHTWNRLVETYSDCGLTIASDKMIAFAGIAQHFQTLFGKNDTYAAGIWRSQLPQALCWFSTKEGRAYRPAKYRAPSWSWASLDGTIRFGHNPPNAKRGSIKPVCSWVDCHMYPAGQDPTGSLRGGSIRIHGSLTSIGFAHDRIAVEDADGCFKLIPGADTTAASNREEHWTLVDVDENTHEGYATCSYRDGLTLQDLARGNMERTVRRTKPSIVGVKHLQLFSLPVMTWIEGGSPWIKGLILCLVDVAGIGTFQRVGRFTARGSIVISKLMESPAETVLIL